MKNVNWKTTLSILLVFVLMFSATGPAFANNQGAEKSNNGVIEDLKRHPKEKAEKLKRAIENVSIKNRSSHSKAKLALIEKVVNSPEEYLTFADIFNDEVVLVYNDWESDVSIALTDNHVDIIETIDEFTFLINGEIQTVYHTWEEDTSEYESNGNTATLEDNEIHSGTYTSYARTGNPGGTWKVVKSHYVNLHFENKIATYKAAILASIIGAILGYRYGNVPGAVGGFFAGLILGSQYTNTSVARTHLTHYSHVTYPWLYKSILTKGWGYSPYTKQFVYLSMERTYYSKMICNAC